MKEWATSAACQGRKQCCACRGDPAFQAMLAEYFVMPAGWPECPFDVTADNLPDPLPLSPPWFASRVAACKACDASCWPTSVSPCRRKTTLRTPGFACPLGRFRSEAYSKGTP